MTKYLLTLVSMLFVILQDVQAQSAPLIDIQTDSLISNHKIIYIDGRPASADESRHIDSVRRRISMFYYDQFRHFSDPDAPYFMFMSKDAQFAMGLGGCVRMRAYYDWGGAIPVPGFAPYLIPMHPVAEDMRHFATTPAGTALFFRVLGMNHKLGEYQLYIECNFNGYQARDFNLQKAYATINDFTIGYAPSTYSDPAAIPPTVDAQGPNNKVSPTSVLVRYMPTFRDKWTLAVSAETPAAAIDKTNEFCRGVSDWLPDFALFGQFSWGRSQHVRLSGIIRTLTYRNLLQQQNHNIMGWGLQLSSIAHPHPAVTTYVTLNYGEGHESLCGDMLIKGGDLIADPRQDGKMYAPANLGWNVGLQYNFRPNLFASANVSQSIFMPSQRVDGDTYHIGWFACANVFWNLTPRIMAGVEYDYGIRRNYDGAHRCAQRVGALAQFSF